MPHLPTPNMKALPLIPLDEHCGKCPKLKAVLEAEEQGKKYGMYKGKRYNLATMRNACRCCKNDNGGIFKYDAIKQYALLVREYAKKCKELEDALEALSKAEEEIELFKQNRNIGKKKTRFKTHGQTVMNLRNDGKTLKEINSITGLAINTIRDIIKESEDNE